MISEYYCVPLNKPTNKPACQTSGRSCGSDALVVDEVACFVREAATVVLTSASPTCKQQCVNVEHSFDLRVYELGVLVSICHVEVKQLRLQNVSTERFLVHLLQWSVRVRRHYWRRW